MDIDKYSLSVLEEEGTIKNYRRYDQSGLTIIEYEFIDRIEGVSRGSFVGVLGAIAGQAAGIGSLFLFPPAAPFIIVGSVLGAPTAGAVTGYAIGKTVNKKHYFNSSTGEYLGNTQSEAALKMYEKGTNFLKIGKFKNANECFNNSYSNVNQSLYKDAKEATDAALEGIGFLETGELDANCFSAAHTKFTEAFSKANETISDYFKLCMDATSAALEGASFVAAGIFSEALKQFRKAQSSINNLRMLNVFSKFIEATQLGSDGQKLFSQGNFVDAEAKFKQANVKLTETTQPSDVFSQSAAASRAASEALSLLKLGYFSEAEEGFGQILRENRTEKIRNTLIQYALISRMAANGYVHLKQANFSDAQAEFSKAKNATDIAELDNLFSNFTLALKSASEGYELWNEGWELEAMEDESEEDRSEEAKSKFKQAKEKFKEASKFENAAKFQQTSELGTRREAFPYWVTIVSLKMEGNDLFNEGAKLQEEANKLCRKNKYKLACEKYEAALEKFKEGLRLSQDQRFQTCVDFVEECLEETKKRFSLIGLSQTLSELSAGKMENEGIDDGTNEVDETFRVI